MSVPVVTVEIAFATDPGDTPTWTDVSDYVRGVSIRRGRQHELARMEAGTCTLTLDNRDRRFDPANTGSPYSPNVIPMRRVRVSAVWDSTPYYLFTGFIEAWPQDWPDGTFGDALAQVEAVDGFKVLAMVKVSGSYPEELSSARATRVLDAISWPAADRNIETGQSDVQAATVADKALEHLQKVEEAENGLVFIDGQGRLTFHGRHHRILNQSASQGTFGDAFDGTELPYLGLTPSYDDSEIWNDVRITREGGTEQQAQDTDSQTKYLRRTLETTGVLITTDAEALHAAQWKLGIYREPGIRFEALSVDGHMDDNLWPLVLGLEFGDRITVRRRPPGGGDALERDCHVEGVQHDISREEWQTTWQLSPASPYAWWVLGDAENSQLGVTTRLAY
ncbi:MAG: hypothetical protein HY689_00230 [Chloroflexi bacterium]|nr:hypothetical protein [Chloroflexota bacterium]